MDGWLERVKRNPSLTLLLVQLAGVVLYPYLSDTNFGRAGLATLGIVVLALAMQTVRSTPALTWIALGLGAPAVILGILETFTEGNDIVILVSAVVHALFYLYTAYSLIQYLFDDMWVTADELYAVGAAFTVLAWAFAYVFVAVQVVHPGSFFDSVGTADKQWFELLYLSFTTLTAVGLSDIGAATAQARSWVMIEEVAGVLYIAMVVSRLVSLTVMRMRG